jgi:hypothetical protein
MTETQIDITKLHNIQSVVVIAKNIIAKEGDAGITEHVFTEILMGPAALNKLDKKESTPAAFERILMDPDNGELRKAYALTKGYCQP